MKISISNDATSQSFCILNTVRDLLLVVCIYSSHSTFTAVTAQSQRICSCCSAFTTDTAVTELLQQSSRIHSKLTTATANLQQSQRIHSAFRAMEGLPVYESSDVSL